MPTLKPTPTRKRFLPDSVRRETVVPWDSLPQEVRTAIEECDEDIRKNGSFTNEEVFQEIDEWLESL